MMRRKDGIAYLNQEGNLAVPCSRYGRNTLECSPVAWRLAYLIARESNGVLHREDLDHAMSLVVNDSDEVAYIVRNYGGYKYT